MSESAHKKIALGFAILAFAFMVFGSALAGARLVTSLIRGFEGALVFGGLVWFLSFCLPNQPASDPKENDSEPTSETLSQTEKKLDNNLLMNH